MSEVVDGLGCPTRPDICVMDTPASTPIVTLVCRPSWSRMTGTPAARAVRIGITPHLTVNSATSPKSSNVTFITPTSGSHCRDTEELSVCYRPLMDPIGNIIKKWLNDTASSNINPNWTAEKERELKDLTRRLMDPDGPEGDEFNEYYHAVRNLKAERDGTPAPRRRIPSWRDLRAGNF